MKNQLKCKYFLIVLAILTLCFIWGNSLIPASISGSISERIKEFINLFLNSTDNKETLPGDGVLRKGGFMPPNSDCWVSN